MSFSVDARALQGLPTQLDRLSDDANAGRGYVAANTNISYGGILDQITGSHQKVVSQAEDFFDRVAHPVAHTSAEAVRAALKYYQHTDQGAAAKLDSSYPEVEAEGPADGAPGMSAQGWRSGATFSDVAEPQDRYKAPGDYSGEFPLEPRQLVTISMSGVARNTIVEATELAAKLGLGHRWDPYEAILKPLTGDWAGLRACKDVFDNLAEACTDMSGNVTNGVLSVHAAWEGSAAESARNHLNKIADALQEAAEPMRKLGEAYEVAAEGAHALFGTLADILNDLIDAVVIFISEATAAAATSETVIGGIAFGAAAGYEAYEVYELIRGLIEAFSTANAVLEALQSGMNGFGVVDGDIALPELPSDRPTLPGDQAAVYQPVITAAPPGSSTSPTTTSTGNGTRMPVPSPAPGPAPRAG